MALRRSAALTASANDLLGALYLAHSSALRGGVPTAVCLSADGAQCLTRTADAAVGWLVFEDRQRGAALQMAAGDVLLARVTLPVALQVRGTRVGVTYWPAPRAGTTSTFTLCTSQTGNPGRAVIVSQTGRPRVAADTSSCNS
jgi:Tfp pilus assembly protein FimT